MAQKIFISTEDRIIASDLLCFLQNKLLSTANDDIVTACCNFFSEEYVHNEKETFYNAIGKKPPKPRVADKRARDINDLLAEMRQRDDVGEWQPTCVALDLANLPQTEIGNVSNAQVFDSLLSLRKNVVSRNELNNILSDFKNELIGTMKSCIRPSTFSSPRRMPHCPVASICNVTQTNPVPVFSINMNSSVVDGAFSTPFGGAPTSFESVPTSFGGVSTSFKGVPTSVGGVPTSVGGVPTSVGGVPTSVGSVPTRVGSVPTSVGSNPTHVGSVPTSVGSVPTHVGSVPTSVESVPTSVGSVPTSVGALLTAVGPVSSAAVPAAVGPVPVATVASGLLTNLGQNGTVQRSNKPLSGSDSAMVGRTSRPVVKHGSQSNPRSGSKARKPFNLVVGKKVNDGLLSLRGADLTVSFYVGQIDNAVVVNDLRTFIEGQNVKVVELEELERKHNRFKSFRLCIRKRDIESIKDADFWPEGIVLRKFFRKHNDGGAMNVVSS